MKQELFNIGKKVAFAAGKYMPKALTGVSMGATAGGIFLAVKAGMEFQKMKDEGKEITWKDYGRIFGPCVAAGAFAIACALAGLTESEKRYAAAAALASMYESKEKEIDAKAREIFGDKEVDKMHEEIVKDKLRNAPEPMVTYSGTAFLDIMTGQYIYLDVETIRARINDINDHMNEGHEITKAEWCDTFDLYSSVGDEELGWSSYTTGNIKPEFTFEKLQSGKTVAALRVTEPRLFYEDELETLARQKEDEEIDEYYRQRNPGWSEV